MSNHIIILAKETAGDKDFFNRWAEVGTIHKVPGQKQMQLINIMVVDHRVDVTLGLISGFPNLKYVVSPNTGDTHIKCNLSSKGIELINLKGEYKFLRSIRSVSEHVFNLIFRSLRPCYGFGTLLHKKTIGILGFGRIGHHVYDLARGFGMKVMTWDKGSHDVGLKLMFKHCDIVSVHLEENEQTKGLIDASLLKLMPKGGLIVNTARASIIDEMDLKCFLEKGLIKAALDVVENRDLLNDQTLGLVVSDHVGGSTVEDRVATDEFIISKLKKAMKRGSTGLIQ